MRAGLASSWQKSVGVRRAYSPRQRWFRVTKPTVQGICKEHNCCAKERGLSTVNQRGGVELGLQGLYGMRAHILVRTCEERGLVRKVNQQSEAFSWLPGPQPSWVSLLQPVLKCSPRSTPRQSRLASVATVLKFQKIHVTGISAG